LTQDSAPPTPGVTYVNNSQDDSITASAPSEDGYSTFYTGV